MEEFLAAVAQSLCNLGVQATYTSTYVEVCGCRFNIRTRYYRKSFVFCGRTYRSGNVQTAVLDLLTMLPHYTAQREQELQRQREAMRLKAINDSLQGHGLHITRTSATYELTYRADLDRLEAVAKQIAAQQEVVFNEVDAALERFTVTFTPEGGFSLN